MAKQSRPPIEMPIQVEVFFRDHWLCSLCRRPTIFHLALKFLEEFTSAELPGIPLAFWNPQWRRDAAPLLDELAACIDHVEPYAPGGAHEIHNFATACARCNARKSVRSRDDYIAASRPWKVKGKYGEPQAWDGLASVFVVLARRTDRKLTPTEASWLRALEDHYRRADVRPSPGPRAR